MTRKAELDGFFIMPKKGSWGELIGKAKVKVEFTDPSAYIRSGGREIVYSNGTRIISLNGNHWKNYEKEGVRWEEAEIDEKAVAILSQYCSKLESF